MTHPTRQVKFDRMVLDADATKVGNISQDDEMLYSDRDLEISMRKD